MIKPWIFEFFRAPYDLDAFVIPRDKVTADEAAEHFDIYWNMWTRAEKLGFEGIFFSEHHFGISYSPSPNLLIAALSRATQKLRFGVMGVVLPFYEAWRVVEEMGMLDHLTQGRLEVGTASGIPPEMIAAGLDVKEAHERNTEAQDILDWVLTHPGEPITHHGKYWNFDNLKLVPATRQRPAPHRWTTVINEASARRSAKRGTRICTGFSSVKQIQKIFGAYREEADKIGLETNAERFGLRRVVIIDQDSGKARDRAAVVEQQIRDIYLKVDPRFASSSIPDAPQKEHGGIQIAPDEYIAGTPAQVAEQIIEQCQAIDAAHFLAILDHHGTMSENLAAFDLFGEQVVPILRSANKTGDPRIVDTTYA